MPINTLSASSESAQYFKLKKFEYDKTIGQKILKVKEPAFIQYNYEKKIEEFASNSFGGELREVTLKEPKVYQKGNGQDFIAQDVFFEFHSYDTEKNLVREVITVSRNSTFCETIIAKLVNITDFKWINLKVGQSQNKQTKKYFDYVSVFSGDQRLDAMIGMKYADSKYPQPENMIELPANKWIDGKKKVLNVETNKFELVDSKVLNEEWVFLKDEIFDNALQAIIENVKTYADNNPNGYDHNKVKSESDIDEIEGQTFEDSEMPEINVDEITTVMPF